MAVRVEMTDRIGEAFQRKQRKLVVPLTDGGS